MWMFNVIRVLIVVRQRSSTKLILYLYRYPFIFFMKCQPNKLTTDHYLYCEYIRTWTYWWWHEHTYQVHKNWITAQYHHTFTFIFFPLRLERLCTSNALTIAKVQVTSRKSIAIIACSCSFQDQQVQVQVQVQVHVVFGVVEGGCQWQYQYQCQYNFLW